MLRLGGSPTSLFDLLPKQAAFLIASGPSLNSLDLTILANRGVLTMGVNNSPKKFRPSLWTCVDSPAHFLQSIWKDPTIMKFLRDENEKSPIFDNDLWCESSALACDCPNTFVYRSNTSFEAETFLTEDSVNWGNSSEEGGGRSVLLAALKILYYLGVRTVYLLGVDFSMSSDSTYCFSQARNQSSIESNNQTYRILNTRFRQLLPYFEAAGFHVWNCNPASRLEVFPFLSFDDAIEDALRDMPSDLQSERTEGLYDRNPDSNDSLDQVSLVKAGNNERVRVQRPKGDKKPKVHEASRLPPAKRPVDSCILLMADHRQEWLLPWWIENWQRVAPHLPVAVVDLGLSDEAKSSLPKNVSFLHLDLPRDEFDNPWFYKPFAIAQSPFEFTLFVDLDCELRRDPALALSWARQGIVLGRDRHPMGKYRKLFREGFFFNSGLIAVSRDNPIIEAWCRDTRKLHDKLRSDQEILNLTLCEEEAEIVALPEHFHQLRLDGDHPEATVMHWTGDTGKRHIRRLMEQISKG